MGRGTVSIAPPGSLANVPTPRGLADARMAAAQGGDWAALERQGVIDRRGPVGGGGGGGGGPDLFAESQSMRQQAQKLFQQAQGERDPRRKSPMLREARALMGMAESAMGTAAKMYGDDSTAATEANKLAAAAATASAEKPLTDKDRSEIIKNLAAAGYDQQRSQQLAQQIAQGGFDPFKLDEGTVNALVTAFGDRSVAQKYIDSMKAQHRSNAATNFLRQRNIDPEDIIAGYRAGQLTLADPSVQLLKQAGMLPDETEKKAMGGLVGSQLYDTPVSYAEGGMVGYEDAMEPMLDMGGMDMGDDMGGMDMGALDMAGMGGDLGMAGMDAAGPDPMMQDYEQYAMVAEQMGLPVIPYEQFAQIMMAAQQQEAAPPEGAMEFARGGPVDASGKMVIDPNPAAATDSIPAVIDGQKPAALDSGEFVIPRHAVMFHGIDKLNKLIAQAGEQ